MKDRAMTDPGWQQPDARIDPDVAVVIAAAERGHTFEDLLSSADREAFIAFRNGIV
jgi:hypothetical protein